jgi:hypothetical protein
MNDIAPGMRRDDEAEQRRTELQRTELAASERRAGELRAMTAKTTFASLLAASAAKPALPTVVRTEIPPRLRTNAPGDEPREPRPGIDKELRAEGPREGHSPLDDAAEADTQTMRSDRLRSGAETALPQLGIAPEPPAQPARPTPLPSAGPALKAEQVAAVRAAAHPVPDQGRPSLAFALDRGAMAGMELVVVALGDGAVGLRLAGKPPPRNDLQKAVAALVAQLEDAGLSVREVGFHTLGRPQRGGR